MRLLQGFEHGGSDDEIEDAPYQENRETVFHFITLMVVSLSTREASTVGLVEKESLGLEF